MPPGCALRSLRRQVVRSIELERPMPDLKSALGSPENARKILSSHGPREDTLLHTVCIHPSVTLDLVRWLVGLYPEAVKQQALFGVYPLQKACSNYHVPLDLVVYLINAGPEEALRAGHKYYNEADPHADPHAVDLCRLGGWNPHGAAPGKRLAGTFTPQ